MPRDRFFIEGTHALGDRVEFAADDAHKLATVLRKTSGERVQVIDSAGGGFLATLTVEGKRVGAVLDERFERAAPEADVRIALAQAIPKGQKMDFIVEKATELGVATIIPLRSERVVGEHTGDTKIERWRRIAKSAAQQSGRPRITQIPPIATWDDVLATFPHYDRVYIPWELADPRPLRDVFEHEARTLSTVLVIIGPEGGFSHAEVARAQAAGAGAISLGPRILRTETAGIVVVSALLYARGML